MASDQQKLSEFKADLRRAAVEYRYYVDSGDMYHAILNFAAEAALPTPGWLIPEPQPKQWENYKRALERSVEKRQEALDQRKEEAEERFKPEEERTKDVDQEQQGVRERTSKRAKHNAESQGRREEQARERQRQQREERTKRLHQATEREENEPGRLNKPRPTQMPA